MVRKLSVNVGKVYIYGTDAKQEIVDHLGRNPHDLILLAMSRRSGLPGFPLTLYVPTGPRGFIAPDHGALVLHEPRALRGQTGQEIVKAAKQREAGLIVLPTRAREGFLDALTGHLVDKLVRLAPCPVLAVPVRKA